ncbi:MAG: hypothetical protein L3J74_17395 [Bacteroidales bacterium]|nr:hypothetical protein [Bacteroidales bacterium]
MKIFIVAVLFVFFANNIFGQKKTLPKWLLNPDYYNNPEYAIGISDPLPDSTMAFEQAKNRALLNYGIFHKGKYASLTAVSYANTFQNNFNMNNLETILFSSILSANFAIIDSFEIIRKDYSAYDECFVLLRKTKLLKTKADTLKFSLVRQTAFYKDDAGIPISTDELEIKALINHKALIYYKASRDILSKYSIVSQFRYKTRWKTFEVKNKYRNYSNNSIKEQETYQCSENLNYGVWAAFMYALSDQISIYSSLNENIIQRLVSIRQGNLQKEILASELEILYNTKKIEKQNIDIRLKSLEVAENKLSIKLFKKKLMQNINYSLPALSRKDRKILKTMQKEQWQEINAENIKQAFYIQKLYQNKNNYIHSETKTKSGNIALGIIHGILIARLDLETQIKTKIVSVSKLETGTNINSVIKNSKSVSNANTKNIFPYLFFIKKINTNAYLINTKLFYKIAD